MKYTNFILIASLISSFSLKAGDQDFSTKALAKAGSAAKTAGHVAKTGGYAVLTGASGVTMLIPAAFLAVIGYELADGLVVVPSIDEASVSFQKGSQSEDFVGTAVGGIGTVASSATFLSSLYGMGVLTKYCAVKTKDSAKEVKESVKKA